MAYSQNDPAWRNTRLGDSITANDTIGNYGCNVTAIANVCTWAGNDLNPSQINDICKQNGWFSASSPGDNDLVNRDDIPALLCSNLGFVGRTNWSGPTDINFFNDASDPNIAYIIEIDASAAPGVQTHYVMVWSKPDANDLEIDDSWDGIRKALSHYGSPSAIIQSAMKFVKVASPAPVPDPVPVVVPVPDPVPPPYIPPAAPVVAIPAEQYKLLTTLMTFPTALDAMAGTGALGTIAPGTYYVWARNNKAYQLSSDNIHEPTGGWVNTIDNKVVVPVKSVPPTPVVLLPSQVKPGTANDTKWMASYKPFHHGNTSDLYEVKQHITMLDYSGKRNPVPLGPTNQINIPGTFIKDGVMFYRVRSGRDEFFSWFYGIPLFDDNGNINLVKVVETDPSKIERRFSDFVHYWKDDFKDIWDIIIRKKK